METFSYKPTQTEINDLETKHHRPVKTFEELSEEERAIYLRQKLSAIKYREESGFYTDRKSTNDRLQETPYIIIKKEYIAVI